jgi:NADPH:quinone reductase-like Zn-dependent oxidoreductase
MNTPAAENLHYLRELIATGQVMPVVDRTYPIEETRRALRYLVDEHAQGKVVIAV